MAGSGLLPSILKKHIPIVHTPWVALIAMAAGSYLFNVLLFVFEEHLMEYFVLLCVLASFIVYIAFFVSYLQFQSSHTSIHRNCNSPFGKAGGYMGIIVFLTCIVGTLGFQPNDYIPAAILIGFTLMVLGIFWVFLRGTHEFSDEEKEELFKAYLVNGK
jgi:L-asparagine transporter-like permease